MWKDSIDCSPDEYSNISYSDMEEYEGMPFGELQSGKKSLKVSKSQRYTCPYCPKKSKVTYLPNELFAHAGYVAYAQPAFKGLGLSKVTHDEVQGSGSSKQRQPINKCNEDELLVWTPTGVVVNIPVKVKVEKPVGESGSKLRDDCKAKGYNIRKVKAMWDYKGFPGNALVQFVELNDCLLFEEDYELEHHGKKDLLDNECQGSGLYAWMARADDFCADIISGKYLRKMGDLKTIARMGEEEERKRKKLKMMLLESK